MSNTRCTSLATYATVAALLSFVPSTSFGVAMRWYVDIKDMEGTSSTIFRPPISFVADVLGYFDAEDRNGDGTIVQSEVLAIEPWPGVIYPSPADTLLYFTYDPAAGLAYAIDGYRYAVVFGQRIDVFSDIGRTVLQWTPSTVTTIAPPVPVPELSALAMSVAGLGVVGLALAKKPVHGR